VQGAWELSLPKTLAGVPLVLQITQAPDAVGAFVRDGDNELHLRDLTVRGEQVRFGLFYKGHLMHSKGPWPGTR